MPSSPGGGGTVEHGRTRTLHGRTGTKGGASPGLSGFVLVSPCSSPPSDPRHPPHLLEGGDPLGELPESRLAQGAHAVLDRLALDLGGVGGLEDEVLDPLVHGQDLEDAGAAEVAGAAALETALPLLDLDPF